MLRKLPLKNTQLEFNKQLTYMHIYRGNSRIRLSTIQRREASLHIVFINSLTWGENKVAEFSNTCHSTYW